MKQLTNLFILLILLSVHAGFSQTFNLPEAVLSEIDSNSAKNNLFFLASDELEGRGNGQKGLEIAAKYIERQFAAAGLEPLVEKSFIQPMYYYQCQLGHANQMLWLKKSKNSTRKICGTYRVDYFVQDLSGISCSIQAPVVFAGYGIEASEEGWDDYKNLKVKDKVVLVLDGVPEVKNDRGESFFGRRKGIFRNPLNKMRTALEKGAAALIVLMDNAEFAAKLEQYDRAVNRIFYSTEIKRNSLPIFFISAEFADLLSDSGDTINRFDLFTLKNEEVRKIKKALRETEVQLKVDYCRKLQNGVNILAVKKGVDSQLKDEYVLLTAHFDHLGVEGDKIYNGADDNGSGTVGLLEISRAFARHVKDNRRSIIFAAFSGEELNLLGSRYFLKNGPIPPEKIVACVNLDMIGRGEPNKASLIGIRYSDDMKNIAYQYNDEIKLDLDEKGQLFASKSDQWPFIKAHIPGIFLFAGDHEDYHQPTDDPDKINYTKLEKISELAAKMLYHLCQTDSKPKWHPKKAVKR
ncbi:MAG: M20/M25/M40 family metallo-hydrolase [Calditrichia bacterium]